MISFLVVFVGVTLIIPLGYLLMPQQEQPTCCWDCNPPASVNPSCHVHGGER